MENRKAGALLRNALRHEVWIILFLGLALARLPLPLAALFVLGGIAVIVSLVHPPVALYLLIFAVPFGSLKEVRLGPMTVGGTEAVVALLLGSWLARAVARRRYEPKLSRLQKGAPCGSVTRSTPVTDRLGAIGCDVLRLPKAARALEISRLWPPLTLPLLLFLGAGLLSLTGALSLQYGGNCLLYTSPSPRD